MAISLLIPFSGYTLYNFTIEINENLAAIPQQLSLSIVQSNLSLLEEIKEKFLHPRELKKLASYTSPLRRKSYLLGRVAAKKAISLYLNNGALYHGIWIENGLYGEPKVIDKNVHLSITHSDHYAAALVGSHLIKVGIDMECLSNVKIRCLHNLYKKEATMVYEQCYIKNKQLIYCLLWTAKEALVKYLETGFFLAKHLLEISSIVTTTDGYLIAEFKHFPAFQVVFFYTTIVVIAICISKKIRIEKKLLHCCSEQFIK